MLSLFPVSKPSKYVTPKESGFTLIELMIVVAIISILALVALPAYQNYAVRSKVSEALGFAAEAKTAVTNSYYSNNQMPTNNGEAGLASAGSYDQFNFLKSLTVTSTTPDNQLGTIVMKIKIPGSLSHEKDLLLVPAVSSDGSVSWTCKPGAPNGIIERHTPSSCRG
ncbi:MAG: pilin [Halioglobus sp.]